MDLLRLVGRARLDERHLHRRILGQPRGKNTAGRAGPDDHVMTGKSFLPLVRCLKSAPTRNSSY